MEILLLVAIIAVEASGLYAAATFNKRTRQNTAPLMGARRCPSSSSISLTLGRSVIASVWADQLPQGKAPEGNLICHDTRKYARIPGGSGNFPLPSSPRWNVLLEQPGGWSRGHGRTVTPQNRRMQFADEEVTKTGVAFRRPSAGADVLYGVIRLLDHR